MKRPLILTIIFLLGFLCGYLFQYQRLNTCRKDFVRAVAKGVEAEANYILCKQREKK